MRDKPAADTLPEPANLVTAEEGSNPGLRGRDMLSTLRALALQGLKQPVHSTRHALALGGQLDHDRSLPQPSRCRTVTLGRC